MNHIVQILIIFGPVHHFQHRKCETQIFKMVSYQTEYADDVIFISVLVYQGYCYHCSQIWRDKKIMSACELNDTQMAPSQYYARFENIIGVVTPTIVISK